MKYSTARTVWVLGVLVVLLVVRELVGFQEALMLGLLMIFGELVSYRYSKPKDPHDSGRSGSRGRDDRDPPR